MTIQRIHTDDNQILFTYGPLCGVIWRAETTIEGIERLRTCARDLLQKHPRIAMLGVVEPESKVPDTTCRRLSAEVNDELEAQGAVAFAGVVALEGFFGAWVRGVVTSVNMLSRRSYPFKAFAKSDAACTWLSGHIRSGFDAVGCSTAVEELRTESREMSRKSA